MMRLWLLALLILTPLCRAGEGESLRVMTDLWPPFRMEDENGQLQGLDIDLLAFVLAAGCQSCLVKGMPEALSGATKPK